jgi:hypothetical protein
MPDERGMTIYFTDGSKMELRFPKQVKADETVGARLDRILERHTVLVEADGALIAIPFTSIKYLQMHAAPPRLPDYVIKDATLLP